MGTGEKKSSGGMKLTCDEIRLQCREAYRNEQELPKVKWAAFQEQRRTEDLSMLKFEQKQRALRHKIANPEAGVDAFLSKLRRCLDKRVREVGGTEQSVLRATFLDWDADCSGELDQTEFRDAVQSLGLKVSPAEARLLVEYYDVKGRSEMSYEPLVEDIQRGATHFLFHPENSSEMAKYDMYQRTPRAPLPTFARRFVKKLRQKLLGSIKKSGEYERILIRRAFLNWDADSSGKLDAGEFIGAMNQLGITVSRNDAAGILKCYATDSSGEMTYAGLVDDVCGGVAHFIENDPDDDSAAKKRECAATRAPSMAVEMEDEAALAGMFTRRPAAPAQNEAVERFRSGLLACLLKSLKAKGGTVASILRESFLFWDGDNSGRLNARELRGAIGRVGLIIDHDDALQIIKYYDRTLLNVDGDAPRKTASPEIDYKLLVADIARAVPHFISHPTTARVLAETAEMGNSRPATVPAGVRAAVDAVRAAVVSQRPKLAATAKALRATPPRDLLHGAFLRADRGAHGLLAPADVARVLREFRLTLGEESLSQLADWYARDGTGALPYRKLVDDAFPPLSGRAPLGGRMSKSLPTLDFDVSALTSRTKLSRITSEKGTIEKRLRELQKLQHAAQRG
ncbi:hypothetical protein M885DRAFT_504440 [Pelagophyceae sp. CCMP2097]|nr:hypothetical protein M885DRAFT_504440 [Pelagophyceae sp. CCMP2097]